MNEPLVSLLMVARNTDSYIGDAILTARRQTYEDIEIVVLDDGSTDDTRAIAAGHAAEDHRVRVLDGPRSGLAAIRNASLAAARGRWAAILDSDDLLHPRHVERLVDAAQRTGATAIAANMVSFGLDAWGVRHAALFADTPGWREECEIDLASYVRANSAADEAVSAGYLKPMFDMGFLRRHSICYDARLRIAEDYDLVARMLAVGGRFHYLPVPTYFYRRHADSTSSRLTVRDLNGMIAAADSALQGPAATPEVHAAVAQRTHGLQGALAHARAVEALKRLRPHRALLALGRHGYAWRLMRRTLTEAVGKRLLRRVSAAPLIDDVVLIGDTPDEVEVTLRRPIPHRGTEAGVADGLPVVDRVLLGEGASADDAAFAISPRAEVVTLRRAAAAKQ